MVGEDRAVTFYVSGASQPYVAEEFYKFGIAYLRRLEVAASGLGSENIDDLRAKFGIRSYGKAEFISPSPSRDYDLQSLYDYWQYLYDRAKTRHQDVTMHATQELLKVNDKVRVMHVYAKDMKLSNMPSILTINEVVTVFRECPLIGFKEILGTLYPMYKFEIAPPDLPIDDVTMSADTIPFASVEIHGRRWRQRTFGNTYHSYEIWIDDKPLYGMPFKYGYDSQYEWNALAWLELKGLMPGREHNDKNGTRESGWSYFRNKHQNIEYSSSVGDVDRKRDLHEAYLDETYLKQLQARVNPVQDVTMQAGCEYLDVGIGFCELKNKCPQDWGTCEDCRKRFGDCPRSCNFLCQMGICPKHDNDVTMQAGGKLKISKHEWDTTPDDYKSMIKGRPHVLKFIEGQGTSLVPVEIEGEDQDVTMQAGLSYAEQTARDMVGDGKLPDKFWVSGSGAYGVLAVGVVERRAGNGDYEIWGPYDTYEDAMNKFISIEVDVPRPSGFSLKTIEDRLIGDVWIGEYTDYGRNEFKYDEFGLRFAEVASRIQEAQRLGEDVTMQGELSSDEDIRMAAEDYAFDVHGDIIKVGDTVAVVDADDTEVLINGQRFVVIEIVSTIGIRVRNIGLESWSWLSRRFKVVSAPDITMAAEDYAFDVHGDIIKVGDTVAVVDDNDAKGLRIGARFVVIKIVSMTTIRVRNKYWDWDWLSRRFKVVSVPDITMHSDAMTDDEVIRVIIHRIEYLEELYQTEPMLYAFESLADGTLEFRYDGDLCDMVGPESSYPNVNGKFRDMLDSTGRGWDYYSASIIHFAPFRGQADVTMQADGDYAFDINGRKIRVGDDVTVVDADNQGGMVGTGEGLHLGERYEVVEIPSISLVRIRNFNLAESSRYGPWLSKRFEIVSADVTMSAPRYVAHDTDGAVLKVGDSINVAKGLDDKPLDPEEAKIPYFVSEIIEHDTIYISDTDGSTYAFPYSSDSFRKAKKNDADVTMSADRLLDEAGEDIATVLWMSVNAIYKSAKYGKAPSRQWMNDIYSLILGNAYEAGVRGSGEGPVSLVGPLNMKVYEAAVELYDLLKDIINASNFEAYTAEELVKIITPVMDATRQYALGSQEDVTMQALDEANITDIDENPIHKNDIVEVVDNSGEKRNPSGPRYKQIPIGARFRVLDIQGGLIFIGVAQDGWWPVRFRVIRQEDVTMQSVQLKKGDRVECIDDRPFPDGDLAEIEKGMVYTISEVGSSGFLTLFESRYTYDGNRFSEI